MIELFKRINNFFKKEVLLDIDYVYVFRDGETIKTKDSFNIYICQYGKCRTTFGRIDWLDAERILNTLENSKGKVILYVDIGMGTSNLMIPKWAKKQLIRELRAKLNE